MDNATYHADPAISASHLHLVARSPQHYWARYVDPERIPPAPTAAMTFGSLVHCAVLEPDELEKRYDVCPPRNTKAGKERAIEMREQGIEPVTASDMRMAHAMARAVKRHPLAGELLQEGKAEQSFWWDDLDTGLRCKCRPDWLKDDGVIVDLKTTNDASPQGFAKSVATFRYHVGAAHYLNGIKAHRFVFIAVEKEAPYAVAVYELDENAMVEGQRLTARDLRRIVNCRQQESWPGYGDGLTMLSLPTWAFYGNDDITPMDL